MCIICVKRTAHNKTTAGINHKELNDWKWDRIALEKYIEQTGI